MNDTAIAPDVDLDLTADDRPACMWADCTNEALWTPRLEAQVCSHRYYTCSPCRDLAEEEQEWYKSKGWVSGWQCGTCNMMNGFIVGWDRI